MATIRPFRAVRPEPSKAAAIAALPYDVYSRSEARKKAEKNSLSFLRVDRAETQLPEDTDLYADQVYQKAAETLRRMIAEGDFLQDDQPCLYLYELTMDGRSQTGIGACASVKEYEEGIVRRHENTRKEKEDDRTRHIEACMAQTGPIFLAYRARTEIDAIVKKEKEQDPVYDFTAEDGIRHRLWVIREEKTIQALVHAFDRVPILYIADGHHRAASAVRVAKKLRASSQRSGNGIPESEYFLSVIFPDRELLVMDYNRWVHDLNGMTPEGVLKKLERVFRITALEKESRPESKGQFTMYLNHQWYLLCARDEWKSEDPVEGLDVSLLQNHVLEPFFGIQDPKTDQRISFVGGIRGLGELTRLVDQKGGIAFALYPTSMEELFAVADEHRLMPPKSTWFEPKLRSGLLIHDLKGSIVFDGKEC